MVRPTHEGRRAVQLVGGGLALVGLAVAGVQLAELGFVGPIGLLGVLTVIVGGGLALDAIVRRHERSPIVLATLVPWLAALFLLLGELAFPH